MRKRALRLEPVGEQHVPLIEEWLRDAESKRRLGGMIPYRPCFEYQRSKPGYHEWVVYDGQTPVALTGFEIQKDGSAAVILLVSPIHRRRGYGTWALKALPSLPEAHAVREFVGPVEPDNHGAIVCLQAVGYEDTGPDPADPEFRKFVWRRQRTSP